MQQFRFEDLFLNAEIILENISEEELFEYYLYPVDFSKRWVNKFRPSDKSPGCRYLTSKSGILYFFDPSLNKYYNVWSVVMAHYQTDDYYTALKYVWRDLIQNKSVNTTQINNGLKRKKTAKPPIDLKVKIRPFNEKDLNFWSLNNQINITEEELKEYGVFAVETFWENDTVYSNVKDTYCYIDVHTKLILQIYMPLKSKSVRRFINSSGFKFYLNPIKHDSTIFILNKSFKCLLFTSKFGFDNGYLVSEGLQLDREIYEQLELKYGKGNIYSLFDNDRTGLHAAWIHRKLYGIIPLFIPKNLAKDLPELIDKIGYFEVFEMVEEFKNSI